MTMAFTRLKLVALATLFAVGTAAVAHAETVLRRGNGADPETLDPHKLDGVPEFNITYDLFEGLTTYEPGNVVPGAAECWDISDDGLVYTFHLRKDGKWSNGDPLKADDFVYSLRRAGRSGDGLALWLHSRRR